MTDRGPRSGPPDPASFPEPTEPIGDRAAVLLRYLDYFRHQVLAAAESLPPQELRVSRLASGWTPLELVVHLRHVEQRWLVWGFEGEQVPQPWADQRDGRWYVAADVDLAAASEALRSQGEISRAVITRHTLEEIGRPGPRWDGAAPASLERVLFHLLQEYARHAGHLDIAVELATGGGERG
jgi:uncharacterized damage-inducible protein DinB